MYQKFSILLFSLFIGSLPVMSQNALKITDSDSKETIFMLGDHPKMSCDESSVTLSSDKDGFSIEILNGVRCELVTYEEAGIGSLETGKLLFKIYDGSLTGENLSPDSLVCLYDITGKLIFKTSIDPSGSVSISLNTLPAGIYILDSKDKSFKFLKK